MGLKKYEIITVGGNKRVRALRSWQVGDRYVNIGDIGGIVYDERTLSQDGLCWLFSGNFGFPGARIWGDSIVDVAEVTNASLSVTPAPAVDILGSSVVVGRELKFATDITAADAVVLTAEDFEQGAFGTYVIGQPLARIQSADYIRTKNPIFLGGKSLTVKIEVPGYSVGAVSVDRDGLIIAPVAAVTSGEGVTLKIAAGQYAYIRLGKNPAGPTAPADATTAAITFTGVYETSISIIDSHVEINPATSTGETIIKPGGIHALNSVKNKYPEAVIRNSKVSIDVPAATSRDIRLMGQIIGSNATIDATAGDVTVAGIYSNINNLMASGTITNKAVTSYDIIRATDCDNFAVSPTIFPGVEAAQTANVPFIFQGCNVPNGRFYHHAQIANTYKNIDFALASEDLGKSGKNTHIMVSSEIEGMYRLYSVTAASFGVAVESYESIRDSGIGDTAIAETYGTTIYKDAYFNGVFEFAGTNVFGSKSPSHPIEQVLNVQPRVVQGTFNTIAAGKVITGVVPDSTRVSIPTRIRLNRHDGVVVHLPAGLEAKFMVVDPNDKIIAASAFVRNEASVPSYASQLFAFIQFRKTGDAAITPEDLAGVTMTVYNGCKISKPSSTSVAIKGNVRVEDNATLYNANITGSGYFGDNSIVYRDPVAIGFYGTVHMKDNAVFAPKSLTGPCALIHMEGNAKFVGSVAAAGAFLSVVMGNNAIIEGICDTRSDVVMSGNARVTPTGTISNASRGTLVMKDNASIEANTIVIGAITLAGNYKGNVIKTWVGKRTITDVNAPEYDDNVKMQYDL